MKSRGLRSGEWGANSNSVFKLTMRSWKWRLSHLRDSLDVCGVAPSCISHASLRGILFLLRFCTNISSFSMYLSVLTVCAFPSSFSKKNGPLRPLLHMAANTVTFSEWSGFCSTSSGFSVPQKTQLALFTTAFRWKWLSSLSHTVPSHSGDSWILSINALAMATLLTQSAGVSLCATWIRYGKSDELFRRILQDDVWLILRFDSKSHRLVDSFGACLTDSASTLMFASQVALRGRPEAPRLWFCTEPQLRSFRIQCCILDFAGA